MLKRLDRKVKQTIDSVRTEFPNCHFLMRIEDASVLEGFLIAVSDNSDTYDELCAIRSEYTVETIFYMGGTYKNDVAIGVQCEIE